MLEVRVIKAVWAKVGGESPRVEEQPGLCGGAQVGKLGVREGPCEV